MTGLQVDIDHLVGDDHAAVLIRMLKGDDAAGEHERYHAPDNHDHHAIPGEGGGSPRGSQRQG